MIIMGGPYATLVLKGNTVTTTEPDGGGKYGSETTYGMLDTKSLETLERMEIRSGTIIYDNNRRDRERYLEATGVLAPHLLCIRRVRLK